MEHLVGLGAVDTAHTSVFLNKSTLDGRNGGFAIFPCAIGAREYYILVGINLVACGK